MHVRLKHIRASGIFGRLALDHPIAPVTVVVADNEAGKSALLGMIPLAVEGPRGPTFPILGDSPAYDWDVELAFAGALPGGSVSPTIARWMARGTHGASVNGQPRTGGVKKAQELILAAVGRAAVWNLGEFLDLTPTKRMAFLEANVLEGAGWAVKTTVEAVDAALAKGAPETLAKLGDPTVFTRLFDYAPHLWNRAPVRPCWPPAAPPEEDGREHLVRLLGWVKEVDAAADSDARRLAQVVANDEVEAQAQQLPAGTVALWREKVQQIEEEIREKRETRGVVEGRQQAIQQHRRREAELEGAIATLQTRDWSAEGAVHVQKLQDAQQAADAAKRRADEAEADAKEKERAAKEKGLDVQLKIGERTKAEGALLELRARGEALGKAEKVVAALRRMVDRHGTEYDDHGLGNPPRPCPCQACADARSALAFVDEAGTASTAEADAECDRLSREVAGLKLQADAAVRTSGAARRAANAADADARAAADALMAAGVAKGSWERERDGSATRLSELAADLEAVRASITAVGSGDTSAIDDAIQALEVQRKEAQRNADALSDAAGAIAAREEHRAQLQRARETRDLARVVLSVLRGVLESMLRDLVRAVEEPASRILRHVVGAELVATVDEGVHFGIRRGDVSIPLDTASRSLRVATMAALRLVIVERLGGWRGLVVDDAENMAPHRLTRFLEAGLAEVEAGHLDNLLVAVVDQGNGWTPPEGVAVIRLEAR